ncbi:histidine phosphatase family protein [Hymenobacter taeanensis]|uniref:Histidine phosphatase family protein n=1 Tax=Hymenobacter taeanensis TaxID=2735321 RepID=A0A6M6BKX8_9BACT|nr:MULTISPECIES: histidine phosphatase family protein [Hymenobacter]QJX48484.1 histidine phosphatase family protein [Hymenobacter taeanensis]UOQ82019.1 histidine phosphatase family protein [Hymenobacter sp. 5414T-23]
MKNLLNPLCWLLPLVTLLSSCGGSAHLRSVGSPTTVYIARHAEKDPTPGLADPALTEVGQQRAQALREELTKAPKPVSVIFSTNTLRTRTTAMPLATQLQVPVEVYDARQLPALAARIRRDYPGKAVLVVGHSNTILETVEALGAPRPVPTVADNEYNYFLEVTMPRDSTKTPTAVARRYGAGK